MNRNRILNRSIALTDATAALDVALDGGRGSEGRERLEIRMRDHGMAPAARLKVVEILHPIWINPPSETAEMIDWAREHAVEVADLRPVHLVALMATYPFFGDLVAAVGRMLKVEGSIDSVRIRERLKAKWGDRDSIGVATRKGILTLRAFGVLVGDRGATASQPGVRFAMTDDWALWAAAALLLARGSDTTDGATVETAPEFFFLDLRVPGGSRFPLLERVTSGDGRARLALRRVQAAAAT
jgi:hypothetical protein